MEGNSKQFGNVGAIIICAFVGVLFFVIGVAFLVYPKFKAKTCIEPVDAVVVDLIEYERSYFPVFEFTYKGREYRIESNSGTNPPSYTRGESVELRINPDDPWDYLAPRKGVDLIIGIVFTALGGIVVIVMFGLVITLLKNGSLENDEEEVVYYEENNF